MECPLCHFHTEDPAEMLKHISDRSSYPRQTGHGHTVPETIANALGFKYSTGFPGVSGVFDLAGLEIHIAPARVGGSTRWQSSLPRKSSKHRIIVKCPTCSRLIPVGRLHQHAIVHSERTRVCTQCGKTYGSGNHLRTHIRRAHLGKKV